MLSWLAALAAADGPPANGAPDGASASSRLEFLSVDHRKPAPGSAEFLHGRPGARGSEAERAPSAGVPQTEFRAARFNVGQQIIWFKKEYGKGFAGVDMDTVDQQGGGQPDTKAFPFSKVEKGFPKTYLSRAEASQQKTEAQSSIVPFPINSREYS